MVSKTQIASRRLPASMACPRCKNRITGATASRRICDGRVIRRRRMCANCDFRWTTFERWDEHSEDRRRSRDLLDRWLNVHDICGMGVRAVEMSK